MSRFKGAGGILDRATARMILRKSKGHPYYTQQIAHELFDISKTPSGEEDVERAVQAAVDHQSPAYTYMWESVKSPLHRRYLKAVAREPGVIHGHEFIERHRLRSTSHIQRIENQLESKGIIERGESRPALRRLASQDQDWRLTSVARQSARRSARGVLHGRRPESKAVPRHREGTAASTLQPRSRRN